MIQNQARTINGKLYADLVRRGASNLGRQRSEINELNVFPIPDGDTGDNMYLTMKAGASVKGTDSVADVADAVSREMLYGARGNSGVILSRIFFGIAKGLSGRDTAGVEDLKRAMQTGVSEAYAAVDAPVEGTMLTVFRDAVAAASECDGNGTLQDYLGLFMPAMKESLERTPDQLPVLKEAGVIDSGGAGLLAIAEGLAGDADMSDALWDGTPGEQACGSADLSLFDRDSVLEFGYCTEFLLRLQDSKVDVDSFDEQTLTDWLVKNGESVVSFREGSIIKVHIHTFTPGVVLNHCQEYGEFLTVKIENMCLQHNGKVKKTKAEKRKHIGVVAVAFGTGMEKMFRDLGADAVIHGGQTMNPSSEDFVRAFEDINADHILVFPNNSNIIMAAEQAAAIYGKSSITVIRSGSIGEGYIGLSALDTSPDIPIEDAVDAINREMSGVSTGMVSIATRTTELDGLNIREGDYIGFSGHRICSVSSSELQAAEELCDRLGSEDFGVCIVIGGEKADRELTAKLTSYIGEKFPVEVITTDGGQPVYDYIIIFD